MKSMKRIIAFLLLAVMCVMTFAACGGDEETTTGSGNNNTPTDTSLADATTLLNSLYKAGNGSKTKADFDVVAQVKVSGGTATVIVTWTVDNDSIKIVKSAKDGYYTVDLPEENATEVKYTLTATLRNAAGETKEIKYDRILMVYSKNDGEDQDNIKVDTLYKIYVDQGNLGQTLYITGETTGGRYVKGNIDPKLGLDFTMEAVDGVEGGYKFKTTIDGKTVYLTASLNENDKTVLGYAEEGSVWAYEKERNCWVTEITGGKYIMGTYGTYDTLRSSEDRHVTAQNSGVSQFPALLKEKTKAESEGIKEDEITIYNTPEEILTEAYKLQGGAYLSGGHEYTLTGVVSNIDSAWDDSYGNISVTIIVGEMTDKPIQLFRLSGEGAKDLKVGDTVTATGAIVMYEKTDGTQVLEMEYAEMGTGSNGGNGGETTMPENPADVEQILKDAYALAPEASLDGEYTLVGEIISIDDAYSTQYKNITVTIVVAGQTDYPLVCYRLKGDGADTLAVGDTVAVKGTIVNYATKDKETGEITKTTVEFNSGCVIVAVKKGEGGNNGGETTPTEPIEITIPDFNTIANGQASDSYTTQLYIVVGTIIGIDNLEHGNMTIKDEQGNTLYIYGTYGADGTTKYGQLTEKPDEGDVITVVGPAGNYNGSVQMKNGTITAYTAGELPSDGSVSIKFNDKAKCTSNSTTQQIWTENGITLINDKASATNNVALYAPIRCYKGSNVTVTYSAAFNKIVFVCNGDHVLDATVEGATVTVDGSTVTIEFATATNTLTIEGLANQIRISEIKIYPAA